MCFTIDYIWNIEWLVNVTTTNTSWVKHNYATIHTPNYTFKIQYDQNKNQNKTNKCKCVHLSLNKLESNNTLPKIDILNLLICTPLIIIGK